MRDQFHWARLLAFVTGLVNQELLLRNEYRWEMLSWDANYGNIFGNPWLEDPSPGSGRLLAGLNLGPVGALAISRATK